MPNFDEFLPFKTIDETINEITEIITNGYDPLFVHMEIGSAFLFDEQFNYQKITYRSTLQNTNDFQEQGTGSWAIPMFQNKKYWLKVSKINEKLLNPGFQNLMNVQRELLTIKGIVSVNPYDALSVINYQYGNMMSNVSNINSFSTDNGIADADTSDIDSGYASEDDQEIIYDTGLKVNGNNDYFVNMGGLFNE